MPRIGTLALVLMAVFALSVVTTSTAAAQTLDLTWNGEFEQLKLNETVNTVLSHAFYTPETGVYTEPGTATIEGKPGYGTVTCSPTNSNYSGWEGLSKTNNKATDKIELGSPQGIFAGNAACSNTGGLGATATINFNPHHATLDVTAAGTASIGSRYTTEPVTLTVTYSGGAVCEYSTTRITGTFELASYVEPYKQLSTTLTKAPLSVKAGSPGECSKKAYVTATFGFAINPLAGSFGYGFFVFGHLVA